MDTAANDGLVYRQLQSSPSRAGSVRPTSASSSSSSRRSRRGSTGAVTGTISPKNQQQHQHQQQQRLSLSGSATSPIGTPRDEAPRASAAPQVAPQPTSHGAMTPTPTALAETDVMTALETDFPSAQVASPPSSSIPSQLSGTMPPVASSPPQPPSSLPQIQNAAVEPPAPAALTRAVGQFMDAVFARAAGHHDVSATDASNEAAVDEAASTIFTGDVATPQHLSALHAALKRGFVDLFTQYHVLPRTLKVTVASLQETDSAIAAGQGGASPEKRAKVHRSPPSSRLYQQRNSSPKRQLANVAEKQTQTEAPTHSVTVHQALPPRRDPLIANVIASAHGRTLTASQEFVVEPAAPPPQPPRSKFYSAVAASSERDGPSANDGSRRPISASLSRLAVEPRQSTSAAVVEQATPQDGNGDPEDEGVAVNPDAHNVFRQIQHALTNDETGRSVFEEGDFGIEWHENDPARVDRRSRPRNVKQRDYDLLHNLPKERREYIIFKSSDPVRREVAKQNKIAEEMEKYARQARGAQRMQSALRTRRRQELAEAAALQCAATGQDFDKIRAIPETALAGTATIANEVISYMDSILVRSDQNNPFTGKCWDGAKEPAATFNPVQRPSSAQINPSLRVTRGEQQSMLSAPSAQPMVTGRAGSASAKRPGTGNAVKSATSPMKSLTTATNGDLVPFATFVAKQRAVIASASTQHRVGDEVAREREQLLHRERTELKAGTHLSWITTSIAPEALQQQQNQSQQRRRSPTRKLHSDEPGRTRTSQ